MTSGGKAFTVLMLVILGLWGCARGPVNQSAQAERIGVLERKCAKLEDDYHAVAAARDRARDQAKTLESEGARLKKELTDKQLVVKERNRLRQQVATRTSERDNLQTRCDRLKKGLQNLLGQDDALLTPSAAPASASHAANLPTPTQS